MLPMNNSSLNRAPDQFWMAEEDSVQRHYHQTQPQIHVQNPQQRNLQQQQFEHNRQHVQAYQNQPPRPPPYFQSYSYNQTQVPHYMSNDNRIPATQHSGYLQNQSASEYQPFTPGPPSMDHSIRMNSEQLVGNLPSQAVAGNLAQVVIRSPTAPRRGRPPKNLSDPLHQKSQKSNIPKRRGRPPKDQSALAGSNDSDSFMVKDQKLKSPKNQNPQLDDNPPKKRGRPPKQPSPEVDLEPLNPNFLVYGCEWDKCPAELHNLATLKMHLFKVHGKRENGKFRCLWKGCAAAAQHTESVNSLALKSAIRKPREFEDGNKWKRHVEKKHIIRYAWHMGDGPTNSLDGLQGSESPTVPSYLFDKNGNQVTPSVDDQQIEDGDPKQNSKKRFKRVISGLDFVLKPICTSNFTSPTEPGEDEAHDENDEVHNEKKDELSEEDGDETDMEDIRSEF
ncbi:uncharacterized protein EAE97_009936 [Botrytis byssoidea]|uniref:C2H2-type domain-containing protein n=1 Tax=Botrytis byssoidea TaxID=139641 RepID=A0A9P5I2L0_9HELO|nr:uncharacterized protein EAE97_009936 [Botrytis byssoidea]KAF7928138.1 hypothetical protein EAE97_009936 [Botrytis byssoidea]